MDANSEIRSKCRLESETEKKPTPSEEIIAKLHEMLASLPQQSDDNIIDTLNGITVFICRFDFDFYRSISPEEMQNIINLIPFQPMRKNSQISYQTIDIFTILLKNDESLLQLYIKQNLIQLLIENLEYIIDPSFYISCINLFNEALIINPDLRDEFISYNLHDLIMRCIPFPDKIFFQFLTRLTLKPTFSPELAAIIVPSFIAQDVPQERAIVVIECLIEIIEANDEIIMPILNSDFLERTIPQLGKVVYTISTFFKFCDISVNKVNDARGILMNVNICSLLKSALEMIEQKELSFADLLAQQLRSDNSKSDLVPSANEDLLRNAFSLMGSLINKDCIEAFSWVNEYPFEQKFISGELPFQAKKAIVDFLLKYLILCPVSVGTALINDEILRNILQIIDLSMPEKDENNSENGYMLALSEIMKKFEENGIKDQINQLNEEFDLSLE